MNRVLAALTPITLVLLLGGCTGAAPTPTASPDASVSPSPTPSTEPSATPSEAPTPEVDLSIETLTDDDILGTMESGCAIQLFRGADPTDLVYYEGVEKAIMKIEGAVLPFIHLDGSTLGDPVIRSLEGPENGYVLEVDTPLGEPSPESDSTAIPTGTITVTPNGAGPVVVEVTGGLAC